MKIAFYSFMGEYAWGGSEELWSRTAVRLKSEGHEVMALVDGMSQPRPRLDALKQEGVYVVEPPCRPPTFAARCIKGVRRRFFAYDASPLVAFGKFVPDMVCISDGGIVGGFGAMEWCIRESLPYVWVCQANSETWALNDGLVERLRFAYGQARMCCFVSQANRRLLELQIGDSIQRACVVRNPFNVRYDTRMEWPDDGPPWRLAYVGRVEPAVKGQDLLLQVLAQEKWRDRDIYVDIYGSGAMEQTTRRVASSLGVSDQVRFMGFSESVEEIWRSHHALILTSRLEGLPLAVIEAMLCGRPVIVTDVGGNREVVDDNETGFLAIAAVVEAVDEALERAWNARHKWRTMGAKAALKIREHVPADPIGVFAALLKESIQD